MNVKEKIVRALNESNKETIIKMNVKELIEHLKQFEQTAEVLISSDEELNTLFKGFEVAVYGEDDSDIKQIVIYGLSGEELKEEY